MHGENWIQVSNDKADKQCHEIYNALQVARLEDGVFPTKRAQPVESSLIVGNKEFVKVDGSALSQFIEAQSDGNSTDMEDDKCP